MRLSGFPRSLKKLEAKKGFKCAYKFIQPLSIEYFLNHYISTHYLFNSRFSIICPEEFKRVNRCWRKTTVKWVLLLSEELSLWDPGLHCTALSHLCCMKDGPWLTLFLEAHWIYHPDLGLLPCYSSCTEAGPEMLLLHWHHLSSSLSSPTWTGEVLLMTKGLENKE